MSSFAASCLDLAVTTFAVIGGILAFDAFKDVAVRLRPRAGQRR